MKLAYEIKVNSIKEDWSRACKDNTKTKIEGNAKGLFVLIPDKSLFNGLELIKNIKSNESWHRYHVNVFLEK